MTEQYSIGNKFDLVKELSFEPIGCYYGAVSLDGEEVLLLLLNSEVSKMTRSCLPVLTNDIIKPGNSKKDKNQVLMPILDIIDFIEGVAIIMPYIKGITLADYISKSKSHKLHTIKKMLKPVIATLGELHASRKYYGFLNFSTAWVADTNKVYIVGYGLFDKIFQNFEMLDEDSELNNSHIVSCIKTNSELTKITCSNYADYHSIYMFFACLLQGYISGQIDSKAIVKNLNSKSKIYLTPTFCNKFCKEGVSIEQWVAKLQSPATVYTLYPLAALAVLTFSGFLAYGGYQYWSERNSKILEIVENDYIDHTDLSDSEIIDSQANLEQEEATDSLPLVNHTSSIVEKYTKNHNKIFIDNDDSINLVTADKVIKNIFGIDNKNMTVIDTDNLELELAHAGTVKEPIKEDITAYEAAVDESEANEQETDGMKCNDASCYDLISAGIKGPELSYVELGDENSLIMKKPISRNDYYIYCYIEKTCSLKSEFDEATISKCLFSEDCSKNLAFWLKQPMEFINSFQIKKYITWLNHITASEYDIVPDKYWISLATGLNPDNKCQKTKTSDFIAYDGYPEWVKINNTIAFRGPITVTQDGEQCEINLKMGDADKYLGKVFVRLIKTA